MADELDFKNEIYMSENEKPVVTAVNDELTGDWVSNPSLAMIPKTPLDERIAKERPYLMEGLAKLKKILGEETYQKRISPLLNVTKSGKLLLIVAPSFRERTFVEKECIPALKEAFDVSIVRVTTDFFFAEI